VSAGEVFLFHFSTFDYLQDMIRALSWKKESLKSILQN